MAKRARRRQVWLTEHEWNAVLACIHQCREEVPFNVLSRIGRAELNRIYKAIDTAPTVAVALQKPGKAA